MGIEASLPNPILIHAKRTPLVAPFPYGVRLPVGDTWLDAEPMRPLTDLVQVHASVSSSCETWDEIMLVLLPARDSWRNEVDRSVGGGHLS